ncbi:MAG: glucose-6-phosphate isomerase [Candidatus Omnitrophica bacterium]|nr:glucose-6-phosphate isomerase [Candidatus Omnitrophota bacterium]MBU1925033.1 glucose-6-phosphate isomerase [Candidatus Omnitrophota bacterium]
MKNVSFQSKNVAGYVSSQELKSVFSVIKLIHEALIKKECPGNDSIGWLNVDSTINKELVKDIDETAKDIRKNCDVFLSLGIGGSYLGAKAAVEFLKPNFFNEFKNERPKIYFAGQNLSADYLSDLLKLIRGRRIIVNVISKSGTTTETAATFRVIKKYLETLYGKKKVKDKIICTTDKREGALRRMAKEQGYKSFPIPDDIGGRFSVLTAVGLLPIACAGIDIKGLLEGAADFEKKCNILNLEQNPAYKYAAIRHVLRTKGKTIEILSCLQPSLRYVAEWWKQLFGESEGKKGKGIFPVSCEFSTDLHSLGQMIQEGRRNLFETFLIVDNLNAKISIPRDKANLDGLNYLAGRDIEYINNTAYQASASAHYEGGVPNMTVSIPKRTPRYLGQLFYFFEKTTAISGLLLGVNPFDQPGVEAYKKKMFKLLGKPKK